MNYYGNGQKINNYINNNYSNTIDNQKLKNKCDYLFNSYDILKIILCPNLTEDKNKFMEMIINIIKSQIKIFIDIINLNDSKAIYEKINLNNQNLSKQITDIYNSNNILLSSYEINQNVNNINSIFNNKKQKYHSFNNDNNNNYKIGDNNNIRIKLEQINTKIHDSPIKIEIKENNNNYIPIGLSSPISSYAFKNDKNNNFVNIHTYNNNISNNNERKIRSYSALKNFNPNKSNNNKIKKNKLNLPEKIKRNNKSNNLIDSLILSNSLSNIHIKERKNDFIHNINSSNNYKLNKRNKKRIQSIKKYQNIESEVALYLKRENDFNKRKNNLLYDKKLSLSNKKNKQNSVRDRDRDKEEESQDLYQLLPNSLKQTLDDFIKKKQEYIFDEGYGKK